MFIFIDVAGILIKLSVKGNFFAKRYNFAKSSPLKLCTKLTKSKVMINDSYDYDNIMVSPFAFIDLFLRCQICHVDKGKKKRRNKLNRAARPIMHVARGAVERPARMQASRWRQLLLHTSKSIDTRVM